MILNLGNIPEIFFVLQTQLTPVMEGGREVVEFVKGKMDQQKVHILYSVGTFCLKRCLKN